MVDFFNREQPERKIKGAGYFELHQHGSMFIYLRDGTHRSMPFTLTDGEVLELKTDEGITVRLKYEVELPE